MDLQSGEKVIYQGHPSWRAILGYYLTGIAIGLVVGLIVKLADSTGTGLAVAAVISTGILIADLIRGEAVTESADLLLSSGALIWLGNVLVFSLIYWQFDSGGPLARYRGEREFPDFAFTQQMSPELAPPGWRAKYPDYLILGLTTSTAFSPTDVMPMVAWAKLTMALQSLISLSVIGLVIARAVNVFT